MESSRNSEIRISFKAFHEGKGATDCTELIATITTYKIQSNIPIEDNSSASKRSKNLPAKQKPGFKTWSFGTINIWPGKKKDEVTQIYLINKELVKACLRFCCLQEVKSRNSEKNWLCLTVNMRYMNYICAELKNTEKLELVFLYK